MPLFLPMNKAMLVNACEASILYAVHVIDSFKNSRYEEDFGVDCLRRFITTNRQYNKAIIPSADPVKPTCSKPKWVTV